MIRITVELLSAVTGKTTKLGEMHISNDGTEKNHIANYEGRILRKPFFQSVTRTGYIANHDKINLTVWHLIAKMLKTMGYMK